MYKFGRFLTVSVLAICAVSAANATVVTQTRLNTALGDKVNVDQTATNKDKAIITNSSGQITTGTIATGMITNGAVTKGKLDSSVQASLDKADSAIQSHQDISGKQDVSKMVTASEGTGLTSNANSTTKYPSMAAASGLINIALEDTVTDVENLKTGKQNKLSSENGGNVTVSGNTGFVQTVTAADGVVTVTRSAIAENDVTNLTTDLANAQNKIPSGSENSATLASIWVE